MVGVLLSILIPGLGQIYFGKTMRGIIMILMTLVPFLYPIALIWSIIDAIHLSKKSTPPAFSKKEAIGILVTVFIVVPIIAFFTWMLLFSSLSFVSNRTIKPNNTKEEGTRIVLAIKKFQTSKEKLPGSIYDIIGNKPLNQTWLTDAWDEPYIYEVSEDGKKFLLKSKGRDKIVGTKDDIILHSQ